MAYQWLAAPEPSHITYSLAFAVLVIGSITDLKTREVPDWVNYGLIISGIALNALFSVIYSSPYFIINSLAALLIFFGIAYVMFQFGQWGGGDSKMLMGLGAGIGIDLSFKSQQFLLGFFINALFAGALYGLLWSFVLAARNRKKFLDEFRKQLLRKNVEFAKKIMLAGIVFMIIVLFFIEYNFRIALLAIALMILITFYLWVFVKAIEKSAMHKLVEPKKLTEGDWIVKDVYIGGQYVCGPKDLGISKSQIRKLIDFYKNGKIKKILIKEGIPFVPSFLIAFVVTLLFGNVIMLLL